MNPWPLIRTPASAAFGVGGCAADVFATVDRLLWVRALATPHATREAILQPAKETADPRYVRAWRQYRRRLVFALAAWLGIFFGGFVASNIFRETVGRPVSSREAAPFAVAWIILSFVGWMRLSLWRCPHCGRPFFFNGMTNTFARRCMHCGLPKWSRSPGTDAPISATTLPSKAPDLEAEIRFLTHAEGGRGSAVFSGYRGQLHYDEHDWDAIYAYPERDLVQPGDTANTRMWLLSPEAHRGKLFPGKSFEVREGQKVVARGVVTKLLGLQHPPSPSRVR